MNVLNLCSNSTASDQIASLQAQASNLSLAGNTRTSPAISSATTTSLLTPFPVASSIPAKSSDRGTPSLDRIVGPLVGSILGLVVLLGRDYLYSKDEKSKR